MKTVHVFYNATDYKCPSPQEDTWNNYINPNNPRLFLACAASWEAKGWTVKRISTEETPTGFKFKNVLRRDLDKYPLWAWNLWHELKRHAPCLCVNMNVFNHAFYADDPVLQTWVNRCNREHKGMSLHQNGWSASCAYFTPQFVKASINLINYVDSGGITAPECSVYIDDAIIRTTHTYNLPWCGFPFIRSDWKNFKLLHFSRSTIARSMEIFPAL